MRYGDFGADIRLGPLALNDTLKHFDDCRAFGKKFGTRLPYSQREDPLASLEDGDLGHLLRQNFTFVRAPKQKVLRIEKLVWGNLMGVLPLMTIPEPVAREHPEEHLACEGLTRFPKG